MRLEDQEVSFRLSEFEMLVRHAVETGNRKWMVLSKAQKQGLGWRGVLEHLHHLKGCKLRLPRQK